MTLFTIKNLIKKTVAYQIFCHLRRLRYGNVYNRMQRAGHMVPPPYEVKRLNILLYARLYGLDTFIETGTYRGGTVEALRCEFKKIYSVELQPELHRQAKEKFASFNHIDIIHGDSAIVLPSILQNLHTPCLFWLDGHYSTGNTARGSKDTPILEELNHIMSGSIKSHVILIDDARLFTGNDDYPLIRKIKKIVRKKYPNHMVDVRFDTIHIYPIRFPEV